MTSQQESRLERFWFNRVIPATIILGVVSLIAAIGGYLNAI